jgi:hypothetical protein
VRRAERLLQVVHLLRRRRLTTARELAGRLEDSERTVYRDSAALAASQVPVTGEPGTGYRLLDFDLPPLMSTREGLAPSRKWDLRDGRFLIVHRTGPDKEAPEALILVTNWLRELERLVPTN